MLYVVGWVGKHELIAKFSDLAVELEKHSNDHIHDESDVQRTAAAVEGVCADRINAILKIYLDEPPRLQTEK
jgi:hypothetical protein